MQEHSQREELLSEELLEWVSGAGNTASTSNNPGSFLDCAECQKAARLYGAHIELRDANRAIVDFSLQDGNNAEANESLEASGRHHLRAQKAYDTMAAHGHPDFLAALRQQRRNYNPDA